MTQNNKNTDKSKKTLLAILLISILILIGLIGYIIFDNREKPGSYINNDFSQEPTKNENVEETINRDNYVDESNTLDENHSQLIGNWETMNSSAISYHNRKGRWQMMITNTDWQKEFSFFNMGFNNANEGDIIKVNIGGLEIKGSKESEAPGISATTTITPELIDILEKGNYDIIVSNKTNGQRNVFHVTDETALVREALTKISN